MTNNQPPAPSHQQPATSRQPPATSPRQISVLVVIALAYFLRAYLIGHQALRGDEAFSVRFFSQPFGDILASMIRTDPNPPLYYFVLHGWMQMAGRSELVVRWPSALAGVISVALTYRLGRVLLGPQTGSLAALFAAVSPFLIWYSQDARVYALLTALVLAATWQTWLAARRNRLRHWLTAGALWWLALFAHYFAIFPLISVGLALLIAPPTRPRWRQAVALAFVTGLAYLPVALYVAPYLAHHSKGWIQPLSAGEALRRVLTVFSVGMPTAGATVGWQWIGGGVLILLLILGIVRRGEAFAKCSECFAPTMWLMALGLGAPVLLWLVSLARPAFTEQYVISSLPAVLLLAAVGGVALAQLGRWGQGLSAGAAAGLTLAGLLSLQNYYFDPAYAKSPPLREVNAYLEQTARPGEVVLMNQSDPAFFYYYHAPMPIETSPPAPLPGVGLPATEAQLIELRDRYQHFRFFFAPSPAYDPQGFVGQWLDACCEKTSDLFVSGFRVQTYDTPSGSLAARQPYPVEFDQGIALTGYRIVNPQLKAGETIRLTLYWQARAKVAESYTVFAHLLAPDGFSPVSQDGLPRNGLYPTDQWKTGAAVIDPHPVPLPADLPPGEYRLEIGLYRLATGRRLVAVEASGVQADHILLPINVRVEAP